MTGDRGAVTYLSANKSDVPLSWRGPQQQKTLPAHGIGSLNATVKSTACWRARMAQSSSMGNIEQYFDMCNSKILRIVYSARSTSYTGLAGIICNYIL
eukprot:4497907-Pleurochrysis_carterae.AAC.5